MLREMVTRPMSSDANNKANLRFLKRLLSFLKVVLKEPKMIIFSRHPDRVMYWVALLTLIVALLALTVAIPGGYSSLRSLLREQGESVTKQVASVDERVASVAATLAARDLRITSPAEGAFVTQTNQIEGTTPFPHRNHYLVVTPHTIGTKFVEPNPVLVDPWGKWVGVAQFGTTGAGRDQLFMVQALATKATLAPGPLSEAPPDAVYSQAVTVARKN